MRSSPGARFFAADALEGSERKRANARGMPSASASARRSSARRAARPAPARVRWDRMGRVAMLGVLVILAYLYLSAGFIF